MIAHYSVIMTTWSIFVTGNPICRSALLSLYNTCRLAVKEWSLARANKTSRRGWTELLDQIYPAFMCRIVLTGWYALFHPKWASFWWLRYDLYCVSIWTAFDNLTSCLGHSGRYTRRAYWTKTILSFHWLLVSIHFTLNVLIFKDAEMSWRHLFIRSPFFKLSIWII